MTSATYMTIQLVCLGIALMNHKGDLTPHTTVEGLGIKYYSYGSSQSSAPPPIISRSGNIHGLEELDLLRLFDKI